MGGQRLLLNFRTQWKAIYGCLWKFSNLTSCPWPRVKVAESLCLIQLPHDALPGGSKAPAAQPHQGPAISQHLHLLTCLIQTFCLLRVSCFLLPTVPIRLEKASAARRGTLLNPDIRRCPTCPPQTLSLKRFVGDLVSFHPRPEEKDVAAGCGGWEVHLNEQANKNRG